MATIWIVQYMRPSGCSKELPYKNYYSALRWAEYYKQSRHWSVEKVRKENFDEWWEGRFFRPPGRPRAPDLSYLFDIDKANAVGLGE